MENFDFYSPTYFAFGKNKQAEVGKLAKKFGASKVLIHYGGGSAVRSGLVDTIKNALREAGIAFIELGGVKPNPSSDLVYTGIELCKTNGVDFIVAVGGGSVIDSAKAIAAGTLYSGDFWDFFECKAGLSQALPLGVILTISAAGSEGSSNTVISHQCGDTVFKRGTGSDVLRPKFAILNPELTTTLPAYQIACGGADIMAHLFERYFTLTSEVAVTDNLIEGLLKTLWHELPRAVKDPDNYAAQANIMWAGMLAHNNVVGVGRTQDWASHAIEHELSAEYDVAHGAGLAVVFPAWMKYVLETDVKRFYRLATNVFGVAVSGSESGEVYERKVALAGIDKLKEFWRSLGLPVTFDQLGGKKEDIPYLAKHVLQNWSGAILQTKAGREATIGSFKILREEDILKIYELMM